MTKKITLEELKKLSLEELKNLLESLVEEFGPIDDKFEKTRAEYVKSKKGMLSCYYAVLMEMRERLSRWFELKDKI